MRFIPYGWKGLIQMINRLLDLNILDKDNEKSYRANRALVDRVRVGEVWLVIDGISGSDEELEMKSLREELCRDMFEYRTKIAYRDYTQHKSLSVLFNKFSEVPTLEEELAYDEKIIQLNAVWSALQYQGLNSLYEDWILTNGGGLGVNKEIQSSSLSKLSRKNYLKKKK